MKISFPVVGVLLALLGTACGQAITPAAGSQTPPPTPTAARACPQPATPSSPVYSTMVPTTAPATPAGGGDGGLLRWNDSRVVLVYAYTTGPALIGSTLELVIEAAPSILQVSPQSVGGRAWEDHQVAELQTCFAFDKPCTPEEPWAAFVPSPNATYLGAMRQSFPFTVDWIGPRTLWFSARFRDARGSPVLSLSGSALSSFSAEPAEQMNTALELDSAWDVITPPGGQPPVVRTAIAATQGAYPVSGSVDIGPGREVMGGTAGDLLSIPVVFSASSPFGAVTEMRLGSACTEESLAASPWEPFVSEKTYQVYLPINWMGFYVSAQYRDAQGNLSQLACDDISLEGMPPTPAPIPTEWFSEIACFAPAEVRPGPDEHVNCDAILFSWPDTNVLPEGVLYRVEVFSAASGLFVTFGDTRATSLVLTLPSGAEGELIWTVSLVHPATGSVLEHGRCSPGAPGSLFTGGSTGPIQGVRFWWQP